MTEVVSSVPNQDRVFESGCVACIFCRPKATECDPTFTHFVYVVCVALAGRPLQGLVGPLAGRGSCRSAICDTSHRRHLRSDDVCGGCSSHPEEAKKLEGFRVLDCARKAVIEYVTLYRRRL